MTIKPYYDGEQIPPGFTTEAWKIVERLAQLTQQYTDKGLDFVEAYERARTEMNEATLSKAKIHSYPIVGAFYRANDMRDACPAVAILKILPVDTKLLLRPEPDNAVDVNAIAIWISEENFPDLNETQLKTFSGALADSGWTLDEVFSLSEYKLGFIPAAIAAKINLPCETPGTLTFDMSGKPKVSFQLGELE